jgi:hypothetical protein
MQKESTDYADATPPSNISRNGVLECRGVGEEPMTGDLLSCRSAPAPIAYLPLPIADSRRYSGQALRYPVTQTLGFSVSPFLRFGVGLGCRAWASWLQLLGFLLRPFGWVQLTRLARGASLDYARTHVGGHA